MIFSDSRKQVSEIKQERRIGRFSISSNPLVWVGCRDHFLNVFGFNATGFFVTVKSGECEKSPAFILKTEEILDIQKLGFSNSKFSLTNRSYVIWIEPSLFWRECEMKRSFFSALVRAGLNYCLQKNNYEDALYSSNYFKKTKLATIRFLFGNTDFQKEFNGRSSKFRGWVNAFSGKDEKSIRKKLLPVNGNKETSLIGNGSLWR